MNCPHCGMAIPAKNGNGKDAAAKLLAQDRERASAAIAVLGRRRSQEPLHIQEAMMSEKLRLERAIETPALLWSIYRRGEKRKTVDYREKREDDTLPKNARDYDPNHPEFTGGAQ